MTEFSVRPIGFVRSEHREPVGVPINNVFAKGVTATIEILPEFAAGLKDLDGFSHIHLITFLHKSEGYRLVTQPFLDPEPRGLFATRSPRRPNPLGLSLVRLVRVEGNILHIDEADMIDGTPVLDIKPFSPQADHRTVDVRVGWMADRFGNEKKVGETVYDQRRVPRERQRRND